MGTPRKRFFVSYSRADRGMVEPVVALLRTAPTDVFFDIDTIEPGDDWPDTLDRSLKRASAFVVFWCEHSAASEWVDKEWKCAVLTNKKIIPILLDSTPLPDQLKKFQWIDFRKFGHCSDVPPPAQPSARPPRRRPPRPRRPTPRPLTVRPLTVRPPTPPAPSSSRAPRRRPPPPLSPRPRPRSGMQGPTLYQNRRVIRIFLLCFIAYLILAILIPSSYYFWLFIFVLPPTIFVILYKRFKRRRERSLACNSLPEPEIPRSLTYRDDYHLMAELLRVRLQQED